MRHDMDNYNNNSEAAELFNLRSLHLKCFSHSEYSVKSFTDCVSDFY
jgi:hypothetical protein